LNCPAVAPSNAKESTSQTVNSTMRRAGLRVVRASRINKTRKLRTSRGGQADCAALRERRTKRRGTNGVTIPAARSQVLVLAPLVPAWRVLVRGARASRLQFCWHDVIPC
jgi:hypothetical protein